VSPPPGKAIRFRVTGRVQGVGFRYFVRTRARALGLAGRVRNLHDGSVEVEAAGEPTALAGLGQALRDGPPGSRVEDVEERELSGPPAWDRFEIDH
jgi:acylphosphatase